MRSRPPASAGHSVADRAWAHGVNGRQPGQEHRTQLCPGAAFVQAGGDRFTDVSRQRQASLAAALASHAQFAHPPSRSSSSKPATSHDRRPVTRFLAEPTESRSHSRNKNAVTTVLAWKAAETFPLFPNRSRKAPGSCRRLDELLEPHHCSTRRDGLRHARGRGPTTGNDSPVVADGTAATIGIPA